MTDHKHVPYGTHVAFKWTDPKPIWRFWFWPIYQQYIKPFYINVNITNIELLYNICILFDKDVSANVKVLEWRGYDIDKNIVASMPEITDVSQYREDGLYVVEFS